ncbi:hypothetical protein BT63DRAFT_426575 [Microthyrium microscopicum]|uniref:Uncharacterized protein n=1 Tax=Microthyrium microscopicum TaxID=703497 RepID=A0A6A6U7W0_9PEZI|nr:hypothetical protein BT63DRAFT_426575 [Microthyrium microscopicum]
MLQVLQVLQVLPSSASSRALPLALNGCLDASTAHPLRRPSSQQLPAAASCQLVPLPDWTRLDPVVTPVLSLPVTVQPVKMLHPPVRISESVQGPEIHFLLAPRLLVRRIFSP